jgi:hypothetical protein
MIHNAALIVETMDSGVLGQDALMRLSAKENLVQ